MSTDPTARDWQVFTQEPGHERVPSRCVGAGEWLHPYHMVEPHEHVWDVGLFGSEPAGTRVIIERPGHGETVDVPHPATTDIDLLEFEPRIDAP